MVNQVPLQVPRCRAHHDEPDTHIERCPSHKFHGAHSITREQVDGYKRYHTSYRRLRQAQFFAVIQQYLDSLRRKDSLRGAETAGISVRLEYYSASHFEGSAIPPMYPPRSASNTSKGEC